MSDQASVESEDTPQQVVSNACDIDEDASSVPDLSRQFAQETYGNNYKDHLLEQYKLFVEMTDRISQRRAQANTFYISILSGIVGILTFLGDQMPLKNIPSGILALVGFLGMVLCFAWGANIYTHKQLNSGKFKVIHEIEQSLPYPCYDREWEFLKRGTDIWQYCKLTNVELLVPGLISIPFSVLFLIGAGNIIWPAIRHLFDLYSGLTITST